jgi:hypothetical protein
LEIFKVKSLKWRLFAFPLNLAMPQHRRNIMGHRRQAYATSKHKCKAGCFKPLGEGIGLVAQSTALEGQNKGRGQVYDIVVADDCEHVAERTAAEWLEELEQGML